MKHPDNKQLIRWISNGTLLAAALVGGVSLLNTLRLSRELPAGVCPVTSSRPWLYLALALSGVSLFLSFFEKKQH